MSYKLCTIVKTWLIISLLTGIPSMMTAENPLAVQNTRINYLQNPIGISDLTPRFSWELQSSNRNVMQTAYQIMAALNPADLAKPQLQIWNTGKITSDQSNQISYQGSALKSGQRLYWKVKIWDNQGNTTESPVSFFEMGLLSPSDWKAQWIEPDIKENINDTHPTPYLRKSFSTQKAIKDARVYTTAHGLYQLNINGKKITNNIFTPGWTTYTKRLQYQVYDVTHLLTKGENAIGAIIGDGWYRGPITWESRRNFYGQHAGLLLQLNITYTDGTSEIIISDESWKSTTGAILKSEIYDGENYDARLEPKGWDLPGFNASAWKGCKTASYDNSILVADESVPVRITETIKPIAKIITPKGEIVFDFGQNLVGWTRFTLKGKKGETITIHHAEVLDKEGNFYRDNLRPAKQEVNYTFGSNDTETYEPHFTYQGFRYIRISGYSGDATTNDFTACVIHSDMPEAGDFTCSDELVNRLQKNIQWGLRGNFLDVPTDCPQRDERLGWTGDAQVFAPTACFNRDAATFYTKWMKDFTADQRNDGSLPWVVPNVVVNGGGTGWSDGFGATGWADAGVIIPWTVYQSYGDKSILEKQYNTMKQWVDYMCKHSGDRYIFDYGFHFGDWLAFAEYTSLKYNAPDYGYAGANTEKDLAATAYFYHSTGILAKAARVLGNIKDAEYYESIQPKIKAAFKHEFITETGRLTSNTQTAYILALAFNIMPDNMRTIAAKRLADDVEHFGHLTTGFLGTPLISQALTDNGYPDLAYKLLFNKRYPGWLYSVTMGATTIWERWDGIKPDGTFQDVGMNSFNHYAYGAVGNWLYSRVAGIETSTDKPGYKQIIIRPYTNEQLSFAQASHNTMYGKVMSRWELNNGQTRMKVTIPANTTALIYFPSNDTNKLYESGKLATQQKDISVKGVKDGYILIETGSGEYLFETR